MNHKESAQKLIDAREYITTSIRDHSSIKKTPAEQAGIKLDLGENKIEGLIKIAYKSQN